eukprot:2891721-Prymnesium_polylepis.2
MLAEACHNGAVRLGRGESLAAVVDGTELRLELPAIAQHESVEPGLASFGAHLCVSNGAVGKHEQKALARLVALGGLNLGGAGDLLNDLRSSARPALEDCLRHTRHARPSSLPNSTCLRTRVFSKEGPPVADLRVVRGKQQEGGELGAIDAPAAIFVDDAEKVSSDRRRVRASTSPTLSLGSASRSLLCAGDALDVLDLHPLDAVRKLYTHTRAHALDHLPPTTRRLHGIAFTNIHVERAAHHRVRLTSASGGVR